MSDDTLDALRDALAFSPENAKLRVHFAESLGRVGRYDEAIDVLKEGLRRAPEDDSITLALARTYHAAGRNPEALVVVDTLLERRSDSGPGHVFRARLLVAMGDETQAARAYRKAIDLNPDLADDTLAEKLGLYTDEEGRERIPAHGYGEVSAAAGLRMEKPGIAFGDVGGMEDVKQQIRMKIIHPLRHPEIYAAYGKRTGGGVLLYGPPGCGKTHLARATAGEVDAGFLSIGIQDVLDMWIGNSEKKLHEVFTYARQNTPCVLFFDEVDALGAKRSRFTNAGGRAVVNQFLAELDGVKGENDGLLILAATNTPWDVDPAFRRPGRFDRVIFVPPPDAAAREEILSIKLRDKPTEKIDVRKLAKRTDQFSGADLEGLIDHAVEQKLEQAMRDGVPKPLTNSDLVAAAKRVRPTTAEWFAGAKNYALYANQGGFYDDIRAYLGL